MTELQRATRHIEQRLRRSTPRSSWSRSSSRPPERCASTSTTPTASTSRSASGSPTQLRDLLSDYSLEVSSPGADRPLTKPEHFRRFVGQHGPGPHRRGDRRASETSPGRSTDADERDVSVDCRRRGRRSRSPRIRRSNLIPDNGGKPHEPEIVDAVKALEQEKGIAADTLMDALEDALLSAYKKTPGSAKYAQRRPRPRNRRLPRLRADPARPRSFEEKLSPRPPRTRASSHRSIPRRARCASPRSPSSTPRCLAPYEDQITVPRRHPGRLRPDRRADRQAGDPAADPRGRAPDDVRRVPGPRRRAGHRDHPAVRQPLHAGAAARAGRGAAAALRAGLERALRPRDARQGGDHRRLGRGQGPEHRRLAAAARS